MLKPQRKNKDVEEKNKEEVIQKKRGRYDFPQELELLVVKGGTQGRHS